MIRGAYALIAAGVLAGCSTTGTGDAATGSTAGAVPTFSGPWSAELRDAYVYSSSDLQRRVLEDGQITEAEVGQLKQSFEGCMSGHGLTVTWTGSNGGFVFEPAVASGSSDTVVEECEKETAGPLISLQWSIQRNPEHQDEATIMAACLAAAGLVPKGYTAEDYQKDRDSQAPTSFLDEPEAMRCYQDPLMVEH